MNISVQLYKIGQSLWLDNIDRQAVIRGEMENMVKNGVIWGVTSNPTIFQKAIASSNAYRAQIQCMSWMGLDSQQIYERLVVDDVCQVADILAPIYEKTSKKDGYVSIEVNPELADKTEETVEEAERLWKLIGKPNVMIKIPATDAGIFAIRKTLARGINVNVTLIFSRERYQQVVDAYYGGLEDRIAEGKDISQIHSVASFFVSRIDTKVDSRLDEIIKLRGGQAKNYAYLKGKIAIACAMDAYAAFVDSRQSERWRALEAKGANVQRLLWASTSTKNPAYSDILYVSSLILPETVNTLPNSTLAAFIDHGKANLVDFDGAIKKSRNYLNALASFNLQIKQIFDELEEEGIAAFSDSQKASMGQIENLRKEFAKEIVSFDQALINRAQEIAQVDYIERLCQHDENLWPANEEGREEIKKRLGWLEAPLTSEHFIESSEKLRELLLGEGYTHAVVLGMGGSSLAPEVYSELVKGFGEPKPGLDISILDSTSPAQVAAKRQSVPLEKTIFLVSSKSGTTSETMAAFRYFWDEIINAKIRHPGDHFIAITDPGTPLAAVGRKEGFRLVIEANPNVGGRYSALIEFGLIPAILAGIDGRSILRNAQAMMINCARAAEDLYNPGIVLGLFLGMMYEEGRDKLTILCDPLLKPMGAWIEQLIAESSGKNGKGILPVVDEPIIEACKYAKDRFFVYLASTGEKTEFVQELIRLGYPTITLNLEELHQLGAEFYRWELATAFACSMIGVNAFDQPDVQLSKSITKEMISVFKRDGKISEDEPIFTTGDISFFSKIKSLTNAGNISEVIKRFLSYAEDGGFIAVNAFVERNNKNEEKLQGFRKKLLEITGLATTLGFGPRFLHSTGQLHKGGRNNGLFIVITSDCEKDFAIPGEGMSFGNLIQAQAIGDIRALEHQGRRVLRIHFHGENFKQSDLMNLV